MQKNTLPSLGEVGSSLTVLSLFGNAISSLPSEIAALTSLTYLDLGSNAISSLPSKLGGASRA